MHNEWANGWSERFVSKPWLHDHCAPRWIQKFTRPFRRQEGYGQHLWACHLPKILFILLCFALLCEQEGFLHDYRGGKIKIWNGPWVLNCLEKSTQKVSGEEDGANKHWFCSSLQFVTLERVNFPNGIQVYLERSLEMHHGLFFFLLVLFVGSTHSVSKIT